MTKNNLTPPPPLLERYSHIIPVSSMKPKILWESRVEYQAFPYDHFRKRVYEIRSKQLAAPYWQVKRNKNGRELHRLETNEMRKVWALSRL